MGSGASSKAALAIQAATEEDLRAVCKELPVEHFEKLAVSLRSTSMSRDKCLYLAKLAEQAERYDEMADHMAAVVNMSEELSVEERNLLFVAYRNAVGSRRIAWRISISAEQKEDAEGNTAQAAYAHEYRLKIGAQIQKSCDTILALLDDLIDKASTVESQVFFCKMKGDYLRYICELCAEPATKSIMLSIHPDGDVLRVLFTSLAGEEACKPMTCQKDTQVGELRKHIIDKFQTSNIIVYGHDQSLRVGDNQEVADHSTLMASVQDDAKTKAIESARSAYEEAKAMAEKDLPIGNETRSGVALNYSIFIYEQLENRDEASKVAREEFERWAALFDDYYRCKEDGFPSIHAMNLLRDNLTQWTSEQEVDAH